MLVLALLTGGSPVAAATLASTSTVAEYATTLTHFNPQLSMAMSRDFAERVLLESSYYRIDGRLLIALVAVESAWHPYAVSHVGARGLGQLMPGTAAGLGVDASTPHANLRGTAAYLRAQLDRYSRYSQETRYALALSAYNAGPGAVARYGGVPPYAETRSYVRNVLSLWRSLSGKLSTHVGLALASVPAPRAVSPHNAHVVRTIARRPDDEGARSLPVPISVEERNAIVDGGGIVAPAEVASGASVPVTISASGSGRVRIVASIGPTVVASMSLPARSGVVHVRVPRSSHTRIMTVRAFGGGATGEAVVSILAS